MNSKREHKFKKRKLKDKPRISRYAGTVFERHDAFKPKFLLYFSNLNNIDATKHCPLVEFEEQHQISYERKVEECFTILTEWVQVIVSNQLCFLTDHQKLIIEEVFFKSTPLLQVAKKLGINPTGVSHAIHGIYREQFKCFHGGALKKLKEIFDNSKEYQNYLELKAIMASEPEEAYLDFFLENSGNRRFSITLSEFLLKKRHLAKGE